MPVAFLLLLGASCSPGEQAKAPERATGSSATTAAESGTDPESSDGPSGNFVPYVSPVPTRTPEIGPSNKPAPVVTPMLTATPADEAPSLFVPYVAPVPTSKPIPAATPQAPSVSLVQPTTAPSPSVAVPVPPTAVPEPAIAYREVGSYKSGGNPWKIVVIPPGTGKADLVMLARTLHQREPTIRYHVFDDAAQIEEYLDWAASLASGDLSPYPEAWARQHEVAVINRMIANGSFAWKLVFDPANGAKETVDLE